MNLKKIWSYLFGFVVEKRASEVSGELEVWHQNGRYVLHSRHANYSFDTLHRVFQQVFKTANIKKRNPQQVLILGFGAGSIASILYDELRLQPQLTGVEVDKEVIALAEKYFALNRFNNLNMHNDDALGFVKIESQQFDLIVSDIFIDKQVPEKFLTEDYVDNLVRITKQQGIGFFNFIAENQIQKKEFTRLKIAFSKRAIDVSVLSPSSINKVIVWEKK